VDNFQTLLRKDLLNQELSSSSLYHYWKFHYVRNVSALYLHNVALILLTSFISCHVNSIQLNEVSKKDVSTTIYLKQTKFGLVWRSEFELLHSYPVYIPTQLYPTPGYIPEFCKNKWFSKNERSFLCQLYPISDISLSPKVL